MFRVSRVLNEYNFCWHHLNVDGVVVVGVHQVDAAGKRNRDDGGSQPTLLYLDLHVQNKTY